ncbi:hypothetical protein L349_08017 [Enterobacter sp. MGH 3]|nr:hypothetical protein L360_00889 [Enterobacter sp. MGH 14]EUN07240.1 hypothetical protein L349_08017 [Enterobacter sp. MGH 3]KLW82139.1 hypothetical protein SK61_03216 [Enterobacter sp. BIDMC100]OUF05973.1 hypothetical protein AZ020_003336 [Enterobacter hormaechei]OUF31210.1 hypothetical protein AZ038_003246 [Enterobacter hormaechei]
MGLIVSECKSQALSALSDQKQIRDATRQCDNCLILSGQMDRLQKSN